MLSVDGSIQSVFSQNTLDLQDKTYCSNYNDGRKLIRWINNKPEVFAGPVCLFNSSDLFMGQWFQTVDNYEFTTITLTPYVSGATSATGSTASVNTNSNFIFIKCNWEVNSLDSLKILELGTGMQAGYVGMTIPFEIGEADPLAPIMYYQLIKDAYMWNGVVPQTVPMTFNNLSPYLVSISILKAK